MSTGPGTATAGIVGRGAALATCAAALERAGSGDGGLLLVAGEAGIGKTAVLQAATRAARARGCTVAWAACPEAEAVPSFWPVRRLLVDIGLPATTAAAEELTGEGTDGDTHRFVLFDRIAAAVREAAADRPLVLVLDDLHWADPSSLRLLTFLVQQIRASPVLVLGSYRDDEVEAGHPLYDLLAQPATSGETLMLSGLATEDVATLVERAGGRGDEEQAGRIRDHTGGNPFFVLHVAGLLGAEGHLGSPAASLPLPRGVRAVLERRLARLSQPCHEVLKAASVIGTRFDVAVLAEVCGLARPAVADLLAESGAARLTQPSGDGAGVEFAHALVRSTVAAQLDASRTAELHGLVADALRRRHGDVENRLAAIAHHELNAAGDRPATRGVEAAERAGRHASAARAFEQAAGHFRRALAACTDPARIARLHMELGDACLRAGDWDAATAAFGTAVRLARDLGDADLFGRAVLGIGADSGGFEVRLRDHGSIALLGEALAMTGADRPDLRARLLARRSVAATHVASAADRMAWSEEAVALARRGDDGRTLAYALSAWCDARSGPSCAEQRLAAAEEMRAAADAGRDSEAALMALRFRIVALLEQGDPAVHDAIDRFAAVAEETGQPLHRWYVPLFRGTQALLRGDLDEADRRCAEAAALGVAAGSGNAQMLSATQAANIALERGHFTELTGMFETSLAEEPWMRDLPIAIAIAPLIDLAHDRTDDARARLAVLAADRFATIPDDSEWLSTLFGVAMSVLRLRDPGSAAVLYEVLLPHAGRLIVDGIAASCLDPVDFLLGRLALVLGRADRAAAHLRAAVEQARRLRAPLLEAHAGHALGVAAGAGDPVRGRELRTRAEAVLRAAGAAPVLLLDRSAEAPPDRAAAPDQPPRSGTFRSEGPTWTLEFGGRTVRMPDAKGLHDLRYLLAHPGVPVPASALQQVRAPATPARSRGEDLLDDRARAAYRQRLADLDEDVEEATARHDPARAARARDERDFLLAELSAATGLGGRARRMGDDVDRARKAVTMRIRNAVARIRRTHPVLARHLDLAVRTGSVCCYEPDQPVDWAV